MLIISSLFPVFSEKGIFKNMPFEVKAKFFLTEIFLMYRLNKKTALGIVLEKYRKSPFFPGY